jgi:hypothetical protein
LFLIKELYTILFLINSYPLEAEVKQKWVLMTEETPSGEETATVVAETAAAEVSEAATAAPGKCTR